LFGLIAEVMAVVAEAVLRIGRKALKNGMAWGIAVAAFGLIFFLNEPFPLIIAAAAYAGFVGGKYWPEKFDVRHGDGHTPSAGHLEKAVADDSASRFTRPTFARAWRVIAICGGLWAAPVLVAGFWQGWDGTLAREGMFFSKAAVVTFGGAYAVLPYVGQQAVEHYGWLTAPQMLDGLAFAETTPGPLIMVLQFVGFLGGWNHPGTLPPLLAATLGAAMTTWTTFVPCFLWIFLGAPHVERLRGVKLLNTALGAVTAAVVGVVLNLAVWFGLHTLRPDTATGAVDWFAAAVALAAFVALHRFKLNLIAVIAASGAAGLLWSWA
jgi:chromate transporter